MPFPKSTYLMILGDTIALVDFEERFISDTYLSWLNDAELMRYSRQRLLSHNRASSLEYLARFRGGPDRFWAMLRRSDELMIGTMTAYIDVANGVATIGILIGHPEARGRGLGREAWGVAMRYLFEVVGLRKIAAGSAAPNLPMVRILRSWRMTLEGTLRQQKMIDGQATDVLLFGILRSEWQDRASEISRAASSAH